MVRLGRVMRSLAQLRVAGALLSSLGASANAQQPQVVDTAAVLAAVAAVWNASAPSAPRDSAANAWYVRGGDHVALAFARAINQAVRPAPSRIFCRWEAPAGAVSGLLTYVEIWIKSSDRVIVSVASSCTRENPETSGAFHMAEYYEVRRHDGRWTATHAASSIS